MELRTSDLYEAAYYLVEGINPHQITCRTLEGNATRDIICDFFFEAEKIPSLQNAFFRGEALVNLILFRRCYGEINNYANNAKRDFRKAQKSGLVRGGRS